jgi:predicted MFS family arabinose efflux permease
VSLRDATMGVMRVDPYRRVLARPAVRPLVLTTLLARIPVTASGIVLTLHIVLNADRGGLGLDFTRSGAVAALAALGAAFGSPLVGRVIDRSGLLIVLVVTTVCEAAFWMSAPFLAYAWLLPGAFVSGLLALPVFSVSRQALAALLPDEDRQAGFSLDSMSVEISFAVGPAVGVVVITQLGSTVALVGIAVTIGMAGLALIVLNPPVHGQDGVAPTRGQRPAGTGGLPWRSWLDLRVAAVLLAAMGATVTLAGTDVAITATMRGFGEVGLIGVVVAVWCLGSLVGGFIYGTLHRRIDPLVLLLFLAALTIPVALAPSWWWVALLLIPSALFCAPLISATADQLVRITPASVRGAVMGSHSSALTVGNALGAPLAGIVVDQTAPRYGFVGVGIAGLTLALVVLGGQSRRRTRTGHTAITDALLPNVDAPGSSVAKV